MDQAFRQLLSLHLALLLCGGMSSLQANAQTRPVTTAPISYMLSLKQTIATLPSGEEISGEFIYTLAAAHADDTVSGSVTYTLSGEARQELAALTNQSLSQVPIALTQKDVTAEVKPHTDTCAKLLLRPFALRLLTTEVSFKDVALMVPEREAPSQLNSAEEIEALFSRWAVQLTTQRARRGIIYHINRLIRGE
ncbi:MAG: hypothetical protein HOP19_22055 [Acidobacteria bacterium]|nr:hypothetical protein [Acidobacteriota bacterium]